METAKLPIGRRHRIDQCGGPRIIDRQTGVVIEEYTDSCLRVWMALTREDKINFHRQSCLNQVTASTQATIQRVARMLRANGVP